MRAVDAGADAVVAISLICRAAGLVKCCGGAWERVNVRKRRRRGGDEGEREGEGERSEGCREKRRSLKEAKEREEREKTEENAEVVRVE